MIKRNILALLSWLGLGLLGLIGYIYSYPLSGADSPSCRMSYMDPSYARIRGFDESHTRFASKYSLYLYREQHSDPVPEGEQGLDFLDGIPILFIPGNAGSYRQVRSIAAEASNLYFNDYVNNEKANVNAKNFDFFTADFNEDFTAFHGRTMLDQAEYLNQAVKFILSLYSNKRNPPTSVIVLGHSMGGVVARVMVSLPNYLENSINTIITLSSPHAVAPLTFDGDILRLYSITDKFWYDGYNNRSQIAHQRLANTSVISITGGLLDDMLPADYTTLGFLVPPSNGFTVFTTGIPEVWTPIDHLAIVWCAQLRRKVAKVLLDIADYSSPSRTYNLEKRMATFRHHLLTGFEDITSQDKLIKSAAENIHIKLDTSQVSFISQEKVLRINSASERDNKEPNFSIFQLPSRDNDYQFSLLSSIPFTVWNEFYNSKYINPSVLICSNTNSLNSDKLLDFTTDNTDEFISLQCVDITSDQNLIPRSDYDTKSLSESSFGGSKQPFYGFQINSTLLSGYDAIVVADRLPKDIDEFVIGQLCETKSAKFTLGKDLFTLITRSADISLPNDRPLSVNINIPGAWSSLLAYNVNLHFAEDADPSQLSFTPFIRQWSNEPYETKWHVNVQEHNKLTMTIHGIAPFTPFRIIENDCEYGINLELWTDSSDSKTLPLDITLSINWLTSLRLLVIRYRLALVAVCVLVTLYVQTIQLRTLQRTKKYPSFIQGLHLATSMHSFITTCILLSILTPLVKIPFVQNFLNLIDPVVLRDPNEINLALNRDFKLNSFYLGLEENCLFFLGPLFYVIGIGLVYFSYYFLLAIGSVIASLAGWIKGVYRLFKRKKLTRSIKRKLSKASDEIPPVSSSSSTSTESSRISSPSLCPNEQKNDSLVVLENIWQYRRMATIILLILAIPIYIPYQLVYVVCCFIQIFKSIRIFVAKQLNRSKLGANGLLNLESLFNYHFSWLLLMLWILPVNVPILIVFVHNLSVNWKTPFSSHHNFLSIIPIIFLMEKNSRMKVLPRIGKTNTKSSTILINIIIYYCYYFIFYCIIYGIRHTYWLHHLLNILSCLILILYYDDEQISNEVTTKLQ